MTSRAFRWTRSTGMISVDQWLRDNGVTLPNDQTMQGYGVSADGNVVVGQLQNYRAFIARGPAPVSSARRRRHHNHHRRPDGCHNFQQSLAASPRVSGQMQSADTVMNGAHSSPLFMLLDAGQSSAWFTGDGGYANGASYRGGLGAGEFGFGRGLEGGAGRCAWPVADNMRGWIRRMPGTRCSRRDMLRRMCPMRPAAAWSPRSPATSTGQGRYPPRLSERHGERQFVRFDGNADYGVRARVDWQDAFKLASTGFSLLPAIPI